MEGFIMTKLVSEAIEKFNLTEEQAMYIEKELSDFVEIKEDEEEIAIRNTMQTNSSGETIYQVVLTNGDMDRHVCYI
jgi:hypothetical protein